MNKNHVVQQPPNYHANPGMYSEQYHGSFPQGGQFHPEQALVNTLFQQQARMMFSIQNSERIVQKQNSTIQQFGTQLSSIGSTISSWARRSVTDEIGQLQIELQRSQDRSVEADNEIRRLNSEKEALGKQLQESDLKLANAVQERDEQRKLAEGPTWSGSAKTSDTAIESKWKQLDYNVRSLAMALSKGRIRRVIDDVVEQRFSMVVKDWNKLLADDNYQEFIIQAYLWNVVYVQIFAGGGKIRGGDHLFNFKAVKEALINLAPKVDETGRSGPSVRHVARWSAQGASLFVHLLGRDQKVFKRLVMDEAKKLRSFCDIGSKESEDELLREMKGILETALNLDDMLMSSKAIFHIRWAVTEGSKQTRYMADKMQAVAYNKDLTPKTVVEFDIAPMLIKIGNADGCNYDSSMLLAKALVVCE
ncbi:hypothetical protein FGRMN_1127 [Fusarium graminum]|nr:hypothetical protein FGRMN_1127 [Fusarium graminum]